MWYATPETMQAMCFLTNCSTWSTNKKFWLHLIERSLYILKYNRWLNCSHRGDNPYSWHVWKQVVLWVDKTKWIKIVTSCQEQQVNQSLLHNFLKGVSNRNIRNRNCYGYRVIMSINGVELPIIWGASNYYTNIYNKK